MNACYRKILPAVVIFLAHAIAPRAFAQPLVPHPGLQPLPDIGWSQQLGKFGESVVREQLRARGFEVFDLNVNSHGIDALALKRLPGGQLDVRVVEVKTVTEGAEFRLGETRSGQQLSESWIADRLRQAADKHPDARTRQVAGELLERYRAHPEQFKAELHGLSLREDAYRVLQADGRTRVVGRPADEGRITRLLQRLGEQAPSEEVRREALRHFRQLDQLRASVRPAVAGPTTELGAAARSAAGELEGAAKVAVKTTAGAEVGVAAKGLKAASKGVVVAGAALEVYERGSRAVEVERKFDSGEITDKERVTEHAKNVAGGVGGFSAALAVGEAGAVTGASWGAPLGPVGAAAGGVIGGVAGAVAGYVGGEKVGEVLAEVASDAIYAGVEATRTTGRWIGHRASEGWNWLWGR
jgi:hypothetical protein